jgi:hypothetical protein
MEEDEAGAGRWDTAISAACAARPFPRLATRHDGGIPTATRPQKFTCDDEKLYAVKFVQNNHGDGKGICAEQIVGVLGRLLEAPVPAVELVEVTEPMVDVLKASSSSNHLDFEPRAGIHHGSRWAPNHSDRQAIAHVEENRQRFGALEVLYVWVTCAGDHQWIYGNDAPHAVLSVDHTTFFPGGPTWDESQLAGAVSVVAHDPVLVGIGLTGTDRTQALAKLNAVTEAEIAAACAQPPDEWGITPSERLALATYLWERKDPVMALLS